MKAFASPGGNLSDFHQISFAAACLCHYGEMALVIVAEWQFILRKWIKIAWSCQSKAGTQNGNYRHISLFSARREFLLFFICFAQI